MQPIIRRRRRKRARIPTRQQNYELGSLEDDSSFAFLVNDGAFDRRRRTSPIPSSCSLPNLLESRRVFGLNNRQNITSWQSQAISNLKPDKKHCHRRQWRPFARRSIPFTKLGTPISDAVLALSRDGSYVLSLGSKALDGDTSVPLLLALRFYGVPSPSGIITTQKQKNDERCSPSPLLAVIPLLYDSPELSPSAEESMFRRNVSPASTPVNILISNDWSIGMAMYPSFSNECRCQEEEGEEQVVVGTLVIFRIPTIHSSSTVTRVFQCMNVPIGASSLSFTLRNLLWRVVVIPYQSTTEKKIFFDSVCNHPGYLLFNDEEDGYRITWVRLDDDDKETTNATCCKGIGSSPLSNAMDCHPSSEIISIQNTWETLHCDLQSGRRVFDSAEDEAPSMVVKSEVVLYINVLLEEILDKRKKSLTESHPEYSYNLISVTEKGRVAEFVITFLRREKPGSLGVFVKVDLFTGTFQELDWVKSIGTKNTSALRRWSNTLALNRRMRELRAGPFSIISDDKTQSRDWSRLCKELYCDIDEIDDYDPLIWSEYAANVQTEKAPKYISFASLYPDCDLVNNHAITSCLPVSSLQSKDSPVQLIYG